MLSNNKAPTANVTWKM